MSAATAIVFPGMGPAAFRDVGRFMVGNRHARELVAEADEVLGYSLVDAFRESEGDYSEAAQVSFLVNCLACARWAVERHGVAPRVVAGPSFGEKAAAAFSGALPVAEAVRMTAGLARCMEDYFARHHRDVVTHSFARAPEREFAAILAELEQAGEWFDVSCYLDDGFYMLSLREEWLEWLQVRLRSVGAMSLYTMRPPMHSSAFAPLRDEADDEVLSTLPWADPELPIVADQDGRTLRTAAEVHQMLRDSFTHALRWPAVVDSLAGFGVEEICIAGPDTLFGRVGVTTRTFRVLAASPRSAMAPRST